jgi:hypothetical protein
VDCDCVSLVFNRSSQASSNLSFYWLFSIYRLVGAYSPFAGVFLPVRISDSTQRIVVSLNEFLLTRGLTHPIFCVLCAS